MFVFIVLISLQPVGISDAAAVLLVVVRTNTPINCASLKAKESWWPAGQEIVSCRLPTKTKKVKARNPNQ